MNNKITCPVCGDTWEMPEEWGLQEIKDIGHDSFDCVNCDVLLRQEEGVVYEFHKKVHEKGDHWPPEVKA